MAERPQIELTESNLGRIDKLRTYFEPVPPRTFIVNQLLAEITKAKLDDLSKPIRGKAKA